MKNRDPGSNLVSPVCPRSEIARATKNPLFATLLSAIAGGAIDPCRPPDARLHLSVFAVIDSAGSVVVQACDV